jgi:hypothetical protein
VDRIYQSTRERARVAENVKKNMLALVLVVFKGVRKKSKIKGALFSRLSKRTFHFGGSKSTPKVDENKRKKLNSKVRLKHCLKKIAWRLHENQFFEFRAHKQRKNHVALTRESNFCV